MRTPGLTLLVAGAGYGKSAWLDASLPEGAVVRFSDRTSPEELAGLGAEAPPAVAMEDLHLLHPADRVDLLQAFTSLGPAAALAITSQVPLGPKERAVLRGPVFERGPADLCLSPAEVAAREFGPPSPSRAAAMVPYRGQGHSPGR